MVNRLASETSPYLLQHAHNPVDWYPWGGEALERARAEDRPVFLSVGYAACHWCHVMERESFEHAPTAAFLNAHFVSIKVDREERPDIDAIYMTAVQAMTGQGGWPMSVFLTPDGRPFFGGTYFPGDRRYGMPSFRDVLESVASAWRERRDDVEASADRLAATMGAGSRRDRAAAASDRPAAADRGTRRAAVAVPIVVDGDRIADRAVLDEAVTALASTFDATHGGWGSAPKFPQPATIEFLLARAVAGDEPALRMARRTLDRMADGGIFDHVGGGFHRYATDAEWLVPHFEKMLYDNAQLARVYLHAHQLTGETRYRAVAEATLDWMLSDLATPDGAFASSLDADTDGVEGATYTWTYEEIDELLGPDDGSLFASAFGVLAAGNWEGRTILSRVRSDAEVAAILGVAAEDVAARLADATRTLLAVRGTRPQPRRDDKAIAAWNGLALAAFADAARILGRDEYLEVALRLADTLLSRLRGEDGRMRRSWKDDRAAPVGFLEDQAAVADGLLALYGVTFDERWFRAARELADAAIEHYSDSAGGFFDTPDDHEELLLRPRSVEDGATPSGNSIATTVLTRLGALTGEGRYAAAIDGAFRLVREHLARYPTAFANWLVALDLVLAPLHEIAIVGDPAEDETQALLDVVLGPYRPHQVLALTSDPASSTIELLQSRFALGGRPTAFVCRDFACRQPVNEPQALAAQLAT